MKKCQSKQTTLNYLREKYKPEDKMQTTKTELKKILRESIDRHANKAEF